MFSTNLSTNASLSISWMPYLFVVRLTVFLIIVHMLIVFVLHVSICRKFSTWFWHWLHVGDMYILESLLYKFSIVGNSFRIILILKFFIFDCEESVNLLSSILW